MPCQLMVGFFAFAKTLDINVDKDELEGILTSNSFECQEFVNIHHIELISTTSNMFSCFVFWLRRCSMAQ